MYKLETYVLPFVSHDLYYLVTAIKQPLIYISETSCDKNGRKSDNTEYDKPTFDHK